MRDQFRRIWINRTIIEDYYLKRKYSTLSVYFALRFLYPTENLKTPLDLEPIRKITFIKDKRTINKAIEHLKESNLLRLNTRNKRLYIHNQKKYKTNQKISSIYFGVYNEFIDHKLIVGFCFSVIAKCAIWSAKSTKKSGLNGCQYKILQKTLKGSFPIALNYIKKKYNVPTTTVARHKKVAKKMKLIEVNKNWIKYPLNKDQNKIPTKILISDLKKHTEYPFRYWNKKKLGGELHYRDADKIKVNIETKDKRKRKKQEKKKQEGQGTH